MLWAADTPLVDALHPSPNFTERRGGLRACLLILHYTGLATVERSIEVLADPKGRVSCHYVIDEAGRITQMVGEEMRAWQAGLACWAGETDINSASIGIEIQNPGHADGYPPFPARQMHRVLDLSHDICRRHAIPRVGVLAHSDVAPARKIDPGEKFDWAWLAAEGVGHWVEPAPPREDGLRLGLADQGAEVMLLQSSLASYGYGIEITGTFDVATQYVVIAFQRHFRQARVDGVWDMSCEQTLSRLMACRGNENPGAVGAPGTV